MAWQQFIVELDAADCDAAQSILESCGVVAITFEDAGDEAVIEPAPGETPLWTRTRLKALIDDTEDPSSLVKQLCDGLDTDEANLSYELATVTDSDWLAAWLDVAEPRHFGNTLWVLPTHAPAPESGHCLRLDPGLAFGTGAHPTTGLCLEWLAGMPLEGKSVLDYGTGSGILAIAAAVLGARNVNATDIDPQSLIATRQNAMLNEVSDSIDVCLPGELPPNRWDILVANIVANPLIELADSFRRYLPPGGRLALSGILTEQINAVSAAYRPWFDFKTPEQADDWVLLQATRNDHAPG